MLYYEYAPDPFRLSDLQTVSPAGQCCLCGDELYVGQCCYRIGGTFICDTCLPRYARGYFRSARVRIRMEQTP